MASERFWIYQGMVVGVVDGDTIDVDLVLGELSVGPFTFDPGNLNDEQLRPQAGAAIDLGFHLDVGLGGGKARLVGKFRFRLLGYNAPEVHGLERPLGQQAAVRVRELLPVGTRVMVQTYKGDAFGRWLAQVQLPSAVLSRAGVLVDDLVTLLIADGWGVAWDGKGDRPAFNPALPYPRPAAG